MKWWWHTGLHLVVSDPCTLWEFNITMEHGHLEWNFPLKIVIFDSYVTVYWRVSLDSMGWLEENLQETIDFPMKYGMFLYFSLKPINWLMAFLVRWFALIRCLAGDGPPVFGDVVLKVVPFGDVKIATENGRWDSGVSDWKWWFSIAICETIRGYLLFCSHESNDFSCEFLRIHTTKDHIQGSGRARADVARIYYFNNDPQEEVAWSCQLIGLRMFKGKKIRIIPYFMGKSMVSIGFL